VYGIGKEHMVGVLEDKADILCQFGNGTGFRILSENFDIARRGHKKTVELLDKRGLPGAILTDNRDKLAATDREADVFSAQTSS